MIISASRRTDIPSRYSDWFFNRLNAGEVLVRNPMNFRQVSRISLSPDVVDCIVFWTKNPAPMMDRLDELGDRPYYFLFTINPYGNDIEVGLPPTLELIETFQALSDQIGSERVVWRYSPLFVNAKYTADFHIEKFEKMAELLSGYTEKVLLSYLDYYPKLKNVFQNYGLRESPPEEKQYFAQTFSSIAKKHHLDFGLCSEVQDYPEYEIYRAPCIDKELIERLVGAPMVLKKDKNQRAQCSCAESIDIGTYNTCLNGCVYCYANFSSASVIRNSALHDPDSSLMIGHLQENDVVKDRTMKSNKNGQISIFNF